MQPKPHIPPFFFGVILLFAVYKFLRFTLLCDCGLLQDTLVNVFHHPWYSGYSDYVGLIDPYGLPWWIFHSLFAYNLSTAVLALAVIDAVFLTVLARKLSSLRFLLVFLVDLAVFYSAPVDILVFWMLALGIAYHRPQLSIIAAYTKLPLWPAPLGYLHYVINGPLSGLTFQGSWRYFLFAAMFLLGWIAWAQRFTTRPPLAGQYDSHPPDQADPEPRIPPGPVTEPVS